VECQVSLRGGRWGWWGNGAEPLPYHHCVVDEPGPQFGAFAEHCGGGVRDFFGPGQGAAAQGCESLAQPHCFDDVGGGDGLVVVA